MFAVATASFVGYTGFTLVMPFLPIYFHELGVDDVGEVAVWSGLSLGVTPAITAMLAPFWGRLSDRFGRKIMVERSLVSFILLMAGMAYVTEAWHVFALRAAQGLFAGYGALAITMAAESAPRDRTVQAIGMVQSAQRLGPAIGPIIGGLVAQMVGLRNAFLVTSGFYVAALVFVFLTYDERLVHAVSGPGSRGRVSFRSLLAFENFLLLMAVVFSLQFIERSLGPVLPLYVAQLGVGVDRVPLVSGILFSITAAAGALGNQLCGWLLARAPGRTVIAASAAVCAAGGLIYLVAPGPGWLFAAAPIFGLAMGTATTTAYTAASGIMPVSARGAGFGLLTTASLTGVALSPIISGVLAATTIRAVFVLAVSGMIAVAIAVTRLMATTSVMPPTSPRVEEL